MNKALSSFDGYLKDYPDSERTYQALSNKVDCLRGLSKFKEAIPVLKNLMANQTKYRYKNDFRAGLLDKIVEAYYVTQDWGGGLEWFERLFKETRDIDKKTRAAAAMTESFIQQNRIDETFEILPYLLKEAPARYSPQLNIALLKAADLLKSNGRFQQAGMFSLLL